MVRKYSKAALLLTPFFLILFTLVLGELFLRGWFNLFPPVNNNLLPPEISGLHLFEPSVGNVFYAVKPDQQQPFLRNEFRIDVRTNNVGMRENDDFLGEHVNIGFIGDSYTFGWGVEAGERYSDVVGDAFPDLEVASYAYPNGYAPIHYLSFLQQRPELIPDLLVLGLFAFNDLADDTADAVIEERQGMVISVGSRTLEVDPDGFIVNKGSLTPQFPMLDWWFRHTAIGRTIEVARQQLGAKGSPAEKPGEFRALDKGEWDETAKLALEHVKRIKALAEQAGSTLLVFYIPFPSYLVDTPICIYSLERCTEQLKSNRLGEALAEWAAAENILFIDPVEYFRVLYSQGQELYFPYDGHWTPQGHAAAGKLIADYLKMYGLVPD